jgi:hypothetical protein
MVNKTNNKNRIGLYWAYIVEPLRDFYPFVLGILGLIMLMALKTRGIHSIKDIIGKISFPVLYFIGTPWAVFRHDGFWWGEFIPESSQRKLNTILCWTLFATMISLVLIARLL